MWSLLSSICAKAVILQRVEKWANNRESGLRKHTQDDDTCSYLQSEESKAGQNTQKLRGEELRCQCPELGLGEKSLSCLA